MVFFVCYLTGYYHGGLRLRRHYNGRKDNRMAKLYYTAGQNPHSKKL
jgi:hypothetical protein